MQFKTLSSPHRTGVNSVTKVMLKVLLALCPGTLMLFYFFGWGVLSNLVLSILCSLFFEACVLKLRNRPIKRTLCDLSVIVTAWLLAISMPAASPWWLVCIASLFATVFGKGLYGGLGYNPFNPAMVGYIVVLISFPALMSQWPPAELNLSFTQTLNIVYHGQWVASAQLPNVDVLTGATVLDYTRGELNQGVPLGLLADNPRFGTLGSARWEWISLAYLLGGLMLIFTKIMPWHTPFGLICAFLIMGTLFNLINPNHYPNAVFHLFSGGAMLGAFFIVTDPVSGCTSNYGRFIFGFIVGLVAYSIRTWGGYPDGIAFGVLLANMCAPLLDYYSKPKVFGHGH